MQIVGIDWDDGNWPKCGKHGVGRDDVEHALRTMTFRIPDPNPDEARYRTASRGRDGRPIFIVYTHRRRDGKIWLRPISARHMHESEVRHYEQVEEAMAKSADR